MSVRSLPTAEFGNLANTVLLKFIRERFRHVIVTFDLDAYKHVAKQLEGIGFEEGSTFFSIGIDEAGDA